MASILEGLFGSEDDEAYVPKPVSETPEALGYSPTIEGPSYIPVGMSMGQSAQQMLENLLANMPIAELRQRWGNVGSAGTLGGGGGAGGAGAGYSDYLSQTPGEDEGKAYQNTLQAFLRQLGLWPATRQGAGPGAGAGTVGTNKPLPMPTAGWNAFGVRPTGEPTTPTTQAGQQKQLQQPVPSFAMPGGTYSWLNKLKETTTTA